ncbi:MAG: sodium:proton antiporter [Deltaproteobacteria bacterium]|nr:sodium:proton antiporter [Deltaproteobacteria bacterium]
MHVYEGWIIGICLFVLLVSVVRHYTRWWPFPYQGWILILGVLYSLLRSSFVSFFPSLSVIPNVSFYVFLPVLVFHAGQSFKWSELKAILGPVVYFATFGVLLCAFITGFPISQFYSITILEGILFGIIISGTDPLSMATLLKKYPLPNKLVMLIEGESMFNDAIALVLFSSLSSLIFSNANWTWLSVSGSFIWSFFGAIPIGCFLGWMVAKILGSWKETEFVELILTLILAYGTYMTAEFVFHVSGVIAVLFSSMIFSSSKLKLSCLETKVFSKFWDTLNELVQVSLFFLLGTSIGEHEFPLNRFFVAAFAVMILSRGIMIYVSGWGFNLFRKQLPFSWQHVLNLGGARGAFGVAMVLMIPQDYAYRHLFLCLAFIIVLMTILVNPILLSWYLKKNSANVTERLGRDMTPQSQI